MTVITKPLSQQEKEKKDEVNEKPMEEVSLSGGEKSLDVEAPNEGRISVITATASPTTAKSSHLCLVVSIMLATALGLSILGYYQLRHHQNPSSYRGSCRIPCPRRQPQLCPRRSGLRDERGRHSQDAVLVVGDFGGYRGDTNEPEPLIRTDFEIDQSSESLTETVEQDGTLELEYELDLEHESFELIQMPELSSGMYVHDFMLNKTAIIDNKRCFVMRLDRSEISPPRSFLDIITKMKDGYELDLEEIQHDMMIVLPELTQDELRNEYGVIIGRVCNDKTTYKLEPMAVPENMIEVLELDVENDRLVKRSVESPADVEFVEISNKVIKYNIKNFNVLPNNKITIG